MDANKSLTANSRREKKEKRRRRAKGEGRSENKKIKTRPGRGDSAMDTTMRQFLPATANNSYGETWRDLQIIQYGAIFGAFHAKNGEQGRGGGGVFLSSHRFTAELMIFTALATPVIMSLDECVPFSLECDLQVTMTLRLGLVVVTSSYISRKFILCDTGRNCQP